MNGITDSLDLYFHLKNRIKRIKEYRHAISRYLDSNTSSIFLRLSSLSSCDNSNSRDVMNLARYSSADTSFSFSSFLVLRTYSFNIFAVLINEVSSRSDVFFFFRWVPPRKHFAGILEKDELEAVDDFAVISSAE